MICNIIHDVTDIVMHIMMHITVMHIMMHITV
jgi:hypothetical protein